MKHEGHLIISDLMAFVPEMTRFFRGFQRGLCPFWHTTFPRKVRLRCNDGQSVFQTDEVAHFLKCETGTPEVSEFSSSVEPGGIEDDVIVNVRPVGMSRDDESVIAFRESKREFPSDLVRFLRRDFSGFE